MPRIILFCLVLFVERRRFAGFSRHESDVLVAPTIMSLEAARDFSIPDLLRLVDKKLDLECIRIRVSPITSAALLESEVSNPCSTLGERGVTH